ncbi:hypothetical protein PF006_g26707 [Phytophthora fragariae]|uniref:Uncharacterized protein n=1 Tax=Phytophthora fragariae TaxID=53985 RepID=A0A6A3QVE1_9STRA|nr:hypothetical protein PF006_g26707 [Phytophthora fragariae]
MNAQVFAIIASNKQLKNQTVKGTMTLPMLHLRISQGDRGGVQDVNDARHSVDPEDQVRDERGYDTLQGSIGENGGQDGEILTYCGDTIANRSDVERHEGDDAFPLFEFLCHSSHMFVDFVSVDTYVEHPRQHGAVRRSNIGDFDMNKMFDSTTDNDPRSHEPLIGDYARFGTMNKQLLNSQIPLPVA